MSNQLDQNNISIVPNLQVVYVSKYGYYATKDIAENGWIELNPISPYFIRREDALTWLNDYMIENNLNRNNLSVDFNY